MYVAFFLYLIICSEFKLLKVLKKPYKVKTVIVCKLFMMAIKIFLDFHADVSDKML